MGLRDTGINFLASVMKASGQIWGSSWRNFMGIGDYDMGAGVQEYTGSKADMARSFTDAWIFRCIEVRGAAIAQATLRCWSVGPNGKRTAVDHDALGVLQSTNPVNWLAGIKLWRASLASLDLHGHFCWQLQLKNGLPTEIYFWPPAVYTPMSDNDGFFSGIKLDNSDEKRIIPASQLVYDATMSPSEPIKGTSRITAARMALNLRSYSLASNLWFFRNNQRPDWLLTMESLPTEENVSRMRRYINQWANGDNRRGPLILGGAGGMHAQLLTTTPKDAEWVAQQRLSQEEVAAIFGVPVIMLNNLERATYSNFEVARTQFWHDTMRPEMDDLADALTRLFLWRWPDAAKKKLVLGFDYTKVEGLQEDINKQWERAMAYMDRINKAVQDRSMTPNKARVAIAAMMETLGLPIDAWTGPVPQGNETLVPYSMIPGSQTSVQAVADILAARGQAGLYVVENVPGAPRIGDNAQLAILQAQRLLDSKIGANNTGDTSGVSAGTAASPPKPPPPPAATGGTLDAPEEDWLEKLTPEQAQALIALRAKELVA